MTKTILLVEDDPGIGRFVSRGLEAEKIQTEWLRTGRPVAEKLRSIRFDAMILDLGLPDVDGLTLTRRLRNEGIETPVLMLTARDSLDDKLEGFRAGADDYLSKPFAFEELLARLNVFFRHGDGQRTHTEVGCLRIDGHARQALVGSAIVPVSSREFDLLQFLSATPNEAVARRTIIDGVWGVQSAVADNVLDVYVGYLRKSLAAVAGAPRIETVRNFGYRLMV